MKIIGIILINLSLSLLCSGQTAFIKKVIKGNKAFLTVGIMTGDSTKWYQADCFFKPVTHLSDTTKIRLIGDLLNYTDDTTISYNTVYNLSGRYELVKRDPVGKQYNLQVNALILINYIAFSSNAFIYSPYPLLYDKRTGKEICCNDKGLREVIAVYKRWFKDLRKKGFNNYCYPLYDKRYKWYATLQTRQEKVDRYPAWESRYDCKEME